MRQMFFAITSLLTIICLGLGWGMFGDMIGLPHFVTAIGSFLIGFLGFSPVYKWLTAEDPEDKQSE